MSKDYKELKDFIPQASFESFCRGCDFEEIQRIRSLPDLKSRIIELLKHFYDPELSTNIVDLGLVYEVKISSYDYVSIDMTLTSPTCPVAESMPKAVQSFVKESLDLSDVVVNIVWQPKWNKDMMSDEAKLDNHMF